jgi:hypothetical protein
MAGMRRRGLLVLLAAAAAGAGTGCKGNDGPHDGTHNIYFMGSVIDGALNVPLASTDPKSAPYAISLVYGTTTVKGKVDASGRYTLGPLPAWNDYGIIIDAGTDYRPFSSYNAGFAPPAPPTTSLSADIYTADTTQTLDFDAYVFPAATTAPDVTLTITQTDQTTTMPPPAAGTIRIQPASPSVIQGKTGEVMSQVWTNSQDLFASALTDTFTGGTYTVTGTNLVYGVGYAVTVYDIPGHQPGSGSFTAGGASSSSIAVMPLSITQLPPPVLLSTSGTCHTGSAPSTTTTPIATVTLTFNVPVADGTTSPGGGAEILDNGVYVFTSGSSTLKSNALPTVQEKGTSLVFSGTTLTIGWTPSVGLASPGSNDIVEEVEYQSIGSIYVQQPGHPESRVSLGTLLASYYPSGYILCNL